MYLLDNFSMNVIKSVTLLCHKHKIIDFEAIPKLFFILTIKTTIIGWGICSKLWYVWIIYIIGDNCKIKR
jgi:hypothetical protein